MKREKGFTLIELMIVIAIIAIIAAIAIPSLLKAKSAAYETSAVKSLKSMTETEATWRKKDSDRNGRQDYWTLDVAAFFYAEDASTAFVQYVDVQTAKADPTVVTNWTTNSGLSGVYSTAQNLPRNGYFFSTLTTDGDGTAYNVTASTANLGGDVAGTNGTSGNVVNSTKFGIFAFPATYGTTGTNYYLVNQAANVYFRDVGNTDSANNGQITNARNNVNAGATTGQWPAAENGDPSALTTNPWAFATD